MVALLTLILKMTELFNKPISSKSVSSRNINNKSDFKRNDSNGEVDRFGISRNDVEYIKKSGKLSKLGKSKSEKTFKSQNLAKSGKKLSKSGNLTNFNTTEAGPKFLTPNTKIAFNHL